MAGWGPTMRAILATALIVLAMVSEAVAQRCVLDPTFGEGGQAITLFGPIGGYVFDVFEQPGGKVLAVGCRYESSYSDCPLTVVRYDSDGLLDPSFGDGGVAAFDADASYGSVMMADGKVVVVADGQ